MRNLLTLLTIIVLMSCSNDDNDSLSGNLNFFIVENGITYKGVMEPVLSGMSWSLTNSEIFITFVDFRNQSEILRNAGQPGDMSLDGDYQSLGYWTSDCGSTMARSLDHGWGKNNLIKNGNTWTATITTSCGDAEIMIN